MEHVFSVTLVRPTSGLPLVEVGAYEYVADTLPRVGDTIAVHRVSGVASDVARGYVTRVDTSAENPISVTAVPDQPEVEAEPVDERYSPPPRGEAA
jgi:hypothetical protein